MSQKRHRILHAIPSCDLSLGGPIEGLCQLARSLQEFGVDIEAVSMDAPGAPFLSSLPFPVHAVGPGQGKFGYCPGLDDWLRDHGHEYDAIVVDGLWQYNGVAVMKTRAAHKRPYFVFTHGMLDGWFRRRYPLKHVKKQVFWWAFQSKVLRHAKSVLFTCEEERIQSQNAFWPYRFTEKVVGYGTAGVPAEIRETGGTAFLDAFPKLRDRRYLLFLSRIHEKKGCDLLIRAFAKIARKETDLDLVMAGPDQTGWQKELEAMARELGVADRVHWTGMISGDVKWMAFLSAEAFTLTSHQENFGVAVAEALSCGTPVLLSNKVNIWREIVGDGAGLATPDDQAGADRLLTQWVSKLIAERAAMRPIARRCFEERFEISIAARKLLEAYGLEGQSK